jgi:CDP-glucose 4,6-dehydratase
MVVWKRSLEIMEINNSFWKGKKVLVTGHTGFKGGWLVTWLKALGANVVGISLLPPTTPNLYTEINVAKGMTESLIADIRDLSNVESLFNKHSPEIVFHLAAQPLVRYSYQFPVETYESNVMGTLHVLEAIRNIDSVRAGIMVTTDKCYENKEWDWGYRENDPMGGHDPYSSSKGAAELLISSYRRSYFSETNCQTSIASVRAGNVIGGGDWAEDRLIPDIITAFQSKTTLSIRNPNATRPWQHVLEPLSGYLYLAEKLYSDGDEYSEAWNFGPQDSDIKTVSWIVNNLSKKFKNSVGWNIENDSDVLHESGYLKLDCSKAKNKLGWESIIDLDTALASTKCWYEAYKNGEDLTQLTLTQIRDYQTQVLEGKSK